MLSMTAISGGKQKTTIGHTHLLENLLPYYADRIVIGMDMARNAYWKSYGGQPGLVFLCTTFRENLKPGGLVIISKNYFSQTHTGFFRLLKVDGFRFPLARGDLGKTHMQTIPIRTTVVGSYPFPGWLEFASQNLDKFGAADIEEMIEDAVIAAMHDQVTAGLDVITDGEQTRLDFNLSFYGYINGIENNETETRKFGPAAHDQRGKNNIVGELGCPKWFRCCKRIFAIKKISTCRACIKSKCARTLYIKRKIIAE